MPLETHDQRFFPQLNPCGISPYVTSSLTRRWVCLLWICLAFRQMYLSLLKNICFCTTHKPSVSTDFAEQIMPILHILCCNGCLVTWTVVSLTTSKFKPLIFSYVWLHLVLYREHVHSSDPYDFYLFPAQFCYIIIYIWKVRSCVHIADRCAPWKISSGAQNLVL
jgi:hypothetical protein